MSNTSLLIQKRVVGCEGFFHFSAGELEKGSEGWAGLSLPRLSPSSSIIPPPVALMELYGTHRPPGPWPGAPRAVREVLSLNPVRFGTGASLLN